MGRGHCLPECRNGDKSKKNQRKRGFGTRDPTARNKIRVKKAKRTKKREPGHGDPTQWYSDARNFSTLTERGERRLGKGKPGMKKKNKTTRPCRWGGGGWQGKNALKTKRGPINAENG